jgi:hypothetical protein
MWYLRNTGYVDLIAILRAPLPDAAVGNPFLVRKRRRIVMIDDGQAERNVTMY